MAINLVQNNFSDLAADFEICQVGKLRVGFGVFEFLEIWFLECEVVEEVVDFWIGKWWSFC